MLYGAPLNPFHHTSSDSVHNRKCRFQIHCLCLLENCCVMTGKAGLKNVGFLLSLEAA